MMLKSTSRPQQIKPNKRYSYLILLACFTIQAVGVGTFVSYGVFFNSLMTEFQWSRATISGASSLAFFLSGLFAILIGRLNDMYGPRNLMRIASISFGMSLILMSYLTTIWQLYLFYGVLFGIGLSAIDVIALTTTARWFSSNRGLMTGLVKVGTGAGQFVVPLTASILIATYGWRQACLYIGSVSLIILFASAQVLKRDSNGITQESNERDRSPLVILRQKKSSLSAGETIRTVQLWTICTVNFLIVFCLTIILIHIVPHARDTGLPAIKAAGVLSTIGGVSMIGRFFSGIVIDRIGSKPIIVVCFIVLVISLLWLQFADSLWMLYTFACVYGLAHGGFYTAISPIVVEIFGIAAHGTIFGIIIFFGATGGAIGPILAGQLFDIAGSYTIIFWIITLFSVIGLSLILSLKPIDMKQ